MYICGYVFLIFNHIMNTFKEGGFAPRFGEFPDLLFGVHGNGRTYFDVTIFAKAKNLDPKSCMSRFMDSYGVWIDALCKAYDIPRQALCVVDAAGHLLAEESLALLLVASTDPVFGVYMLECVTQMLLEGVVCSDSYILSQARARFTPEDLTTSMP